MVLLEKTVVAWIITENSCWNTVSKCFAKISFSILYVLCMFRFISSMLYHVCCCYSV